MSIKVRILLSIVASGLVVLLIGAGPDRATSDHDVILDGVRYSPREFEEIRRERRAKGQYMIFTVGVDGGMLVFTSEDTYNEYRVAHGLEPESLYPPK